MSQNDRIDFGGLDWEGLPVSSSEGSISLELTAVDQDLGSIRSNVEARSCDRAGSSPKCDFHGCSQPTMAPVSLAESRPTPSAALCHDGIVMTERPSTESHRTISAVVAMVAATAVVMGMTSCSAEQDSSIQEPSEVTVSDMASPTDPAPTSPPTSSADKDIPEAGSPPSEVVNIFVDVADGVVQEAAVPLGTPVNIRVRSSAEDEFHLHGYDLELRGTDVLFTFTADRLGNFLLEGHDSGQRLLTLTVFED